MSIFDKIKKIFGNTKLVLMNTISGEQAQYYQFGDNIYKSDTVQQSVSCIVNEILKLEPTHIMKSDADIVPKDSDIQRLLESPNENMTTAEFLEKVTWNYLLNYNSFIIPEFDEWVDSKGVIIKRKYKSLTPIRPSEVSFLENEKTKELFIEFKFDGNPEKYRLPYSEVIHLKRNFSLNQFMGGNAEGNPDNEPLLKTLQLNGYLLDSLAVSLKASTTINGILRIKTMLDDEGKKKEREKFEKDLRNSSSGILTTDLSSEYQPLVKNPKIIDDNTLKFIDTKVLRTFGVPPEVLLGNYSKEVYEAFYQKTIEPLAIKLSQSFTKALFTQRERAFGNKIVFYPKELVFMSMGQTLEMVAQLGASGTLYENEKRTAFGLKPLKELEGVRMQSLNYIDAKDAATYQLKKTDIKKEDDNKESNRMLNIKNEINKRSEKVGDAKFENRSYEFEVREDKDKSTDDIKVIEGRPIVYESKTDISGLFEEVIDKGALDNTDLKDVRFLVNHNIKELPLARSRNNNKNSTMQMTVDDKGMSIRVNLDMKNPRAVELYSAITRGDVSGMSFMFFVREETWDKEDTDYPTRHIVDIAQVLEVSAVTFPAYEDTELNARAQTLENAKALLENRKSLDNESLELAKIKAKYGK